MARSPVLVVGCGSIGRRHIANLKRLGYEVAAFDPDPERRRWVSENLSCRTVKALEAGLGLKPLAAWICTPAHKHAPAALEALSAGVPCFIEKPLAHRVQDAVSIARTAKRAGIPTAVGYNWRFHPALREMKSCIDGRRLGRLLFLRAQIGQHLPDWRPWQDYRRGCSARRRLGGGILLEASHEVDLACWLAGDPESVFCRNARVSALEIDVEDLSCLTLNYRSGAVGSVHLDMVSRAPRRNIELAFSEGTMLWDFPSAELRTYSARRKQWTRRRFPVDVNDLYIAESRAFLARLARPSRDGVLSAEEGLKTMAVLAAAQRSAKTMKTERIRQ